jgi:hypothetical protein
VRFVPRSRRQAPRVLLPLVGALWIGISAAASAAADSDPGSSPPSDTHEAPRLVLELPLVDAPFVFANGGSAPSMDQSLWITADLYQGIHHAISRIADPYAPSWPQRLLGKIAISVTDAFTFALPGLMAWQHEEWHRAVMSLRDISSHDDVYDLHLFADTIAVSHVTDEDLVRLKREHPADQVRMSTAGIEGNYEEGHTLEKLLFFDDARNWNTFLLWLLYFGNSQYMSTCASGRSDSLTATQRAKDGADIARRDFTGLDCNGWTYDLFHPDEPYAARGMDPSGVGIDRYRTYGAMSPAEQAYLRRQYHLSFLNFLDLNLINVNRIEWPWLVRGAPVYFNLALRHLPTAFGYDLRADLFVKREQALNVLLSLHGYGYEGGLLPGIEMQLYRLPVGRLGGHPTLVGLLGSVWLQPERLRYQSDRSELGCLGAIRVAWEIHPALAPYLEVEGKTQGWVAGNVFLGPKVSLRAGVTARIF